MRGTYISTNSENHLEGGIAISTVIWLNEYCAK